MLDVCLLGSGGMMPLPSRFLTSLYVRNEGKALLIDCGEGTQTAMRTANARFKCISDVLITHMHADHVSGLPGLLLTLGNEGRDEPLRIYGPAGLTRLVTALRTIVPELPYALDIRELSFDGGHIDACGLEIDAFAVSHGMPCFGYRIELKRSGKFDAKRANEKGIPVKYWGKLQMGESVGGFEPNDVLGERRKGISLVYSTDTRPVSIIADMGKNADLMVLEGMFGDPVKQERAEKTKHMTMQEAAELAKYANCERLWLTHFSPATPHPEEYIDEIKEIFPETRMGEDGMWETLRFIND